MTVNVLKRLVLASMADSAAALSAGDLVEAEPLLAEALRLAHRIDDRVAQFYLLDEGAGTGRGPAK